MAQSECRSMAGTDERLVLPGVERVGFYDGSDLSPEDVPFPSCLAAALRYIGEDCPVTTFSENGRDWRLNVAYIELLAASGMAFGLRWKDGWHQDNADMMFVADPNEVIRRAFAYAGRSFFAVDKQTAADDEARFLHEIKQSLQKGRPVLGFGVVGPPECGLITGYDESGKVLIGWNFFQGIPPFNQGLEYEQNGYYRKCNWFNDTWSLMIIGDKTTRPDRHMRNVETLRWALTVGRTPEVLGRHTGLAAYAAWAKQVTTDADFLTDDVRVLQSRHEVHNSAVGMVAECRWAACELLKMMAQSETAMASDLLAAAACFRQEHDLMYRLWGLVGGNGNPQAFVKFAEPAVRSQMAPIILEARMVDEQALSHIECALER